MKVAKPDKFEGKNVRSWLKSLDNIFESQPTNPTDSQKWTYAVSVLKGEALDWWELIENDESVDINNYQNFYDQLLEYFEPVNKSLNARRTLRNI